MGAMSTFERFDRRGYRTVDARTGYGAWAATYEGTVQDAMDIELLDRLEELRDPDRPVRLVGIAISGDADLAALRQMARVTGGEAYLAAQPQDVLEVFAKAVLSR